MKTSDFHFDLPPELIASEPLEQRSASRLLCLNKAGNIQHKHFTDLPDLLRAGDLLVFNNSKVIRARLYARKPTGGKVEILIERIVDDHTALAHVKGAKSLKEGSKIYLSMSSPTSDAEAQSGDDSPVIFAGARQDDLLTLHTEQNWYDLLDQYGHIPLPPYMEREDREEDAERYQTVYADDAKKGSVAAPTAGLHFDEDLLNQLETKGIKSAFVTLHVGAGTFQPVREDNILNHKMHSERFEISAETINLIHQTKANGGRVIAVGTTSVRVLESVFSAPSSPLVNKPQAQRASCGDPAQKGSQSDLQNFNRIPATKLVLAEAGGGDDSSVVRGETDIFVRPGYEFKIIDGLITNFHLPESTLIMLVSALMGRENILNAYNVAVQERYRFFSYGDGMLLL